MVLAISSSTTFSFSRTPKRLSSLSLHSPILASVRFSKRNAGSGINNAIHASQDAVIFEPFEEVQKELLLIPTKPQASLARHKYTDQCEAALNEQINVEYGISYVYHAMYAYFDRDNIALKGLAK
ncbi:ferritin-3, chloroplastic-like [Senna tora]|uniref:Ferritin n=1 Tax=Senna tora TaxID=362788 RepID=A0A834T8N0_9FABA|nr:ferritin-3, chloroplastic-like [Senna tora]